MNYRNWVTENKWELCISLYLIMLFVSHHTFTPNLTFFRQLTSNPLFRLFLLVLLLYVLYNRSRFPRHIIILLIIILLLTEYHAWGSYPWEFFENNTTVTFIKKAGLNLYLTYPIPTNNGQLISLSEPHGDFSGQMWQINVDTNGMLLSPFNNTDSMNLNGELKLAVDKDNINKWSIIEVVKPLIEDSIQTIDMTNVKTITAIKDQTCKNNSTQYAKIKFGDKYLTANGSGQLSLSTNDSDNIWYIFKCLPSDKPITDVVTPSIPLIDNINNPNNPNNSNTTSTPDQIQDEGCLENFTTMRNSLNELLNEFRTDTPIGKAYRNCSDGLCYYEKLPSFQNN